MIEQLNIKEFIGKKQKKNYFTLHKLKIYDKYKEHYFEFYIF